MLQCTARFQVRLSVDSFILKLPTHRAPLLMQDTVGSAEHGVTDFMGITFFGAVSVS